jgi:amino acid transporter
VFRTERGTGPGFFITVIVDLGSANDVAKAFDPTPSPDGFTGILFGVLYGVLIFVGFETAANLAERRRPKRSIPRRCSAQS